MEQKIAIAQKNPARTNGSVRSRAAGIEKEAIRLCKVVLLEVQCLPRYFCGHVMKRDWKEDCLLCVKVPCSSQALEAVWDTRLKF